VDLARKRRDIDLQVVLALLSDANTTEVFTFKIDDYGNSVPTTRIANTSKIVNPIDVLRTVTAVCCAFNIATPVIGEYLSREWRPSVETVVHQYPHQVKVPARYAQATLNHFMHQMRAGERLNASIDYPLILRIASGVALERPSSTGGGGGGKDNRTKDKRNDPKDANGQRKWSGPIADTIKNSDCKNADKGFSCAWSNCPYNHPKGKVEHKKG
jgi:hypothetical protein